MYVTRLYYRYFTTTVFMQPATVHVLSAYSRLFVEFVLNWVLSRSLLSILSLYYLLSFIIIFFCQCYQSWTQQQDKRHNLTTTLSRVIHGFHHHTLPVNTRCHRSVGQGGKHRPGSEIFVCVILHKTQTYATEGSAGWVACGWGGGWNIGVARA